MKKQEILEALPILIRRKYPGRRSQIATIAEGFGIEVRFSWGKEQIYTEMLKNPACLFELYAEYSSKEKSQTLDIISPRQSQSIRAQHSLSKAKREEFAKIIALERIKNARRFILRAVRDGNIDEDKSILIALNAIQKQFDRVSSIQSIRGLEGSAYRVYRQTLHTMAKYSFPYEGMRSPSPFVAMLRFVEAELIEISTKICWEAGLDPFVGVYHFSTKWGFPGLAYDLIHAYTPRIIDSVVVSAINLQRVSAKDFHSWEAKLSIPVKETLRDSLVKTLNRKIVYRLDWLQEQDQVTYREALRLQAQCFSRFILDRNDIQIFIIK